MTTPIGSRVRIRNHFLVAHFTGVVVGHNAAAVSRKENDVRLDKPWVSTHSPDPDFCRRINLDDRELEVLPADEVRTFMDGAGI